MSFELANPQEWWITIPPELHHQHWQNSQTQTTESCRWQAYLNQLALHLVLDWLESIPGVRAERWLNERQAATVWEFVTGATVIVGTERWVVIPSEVIEDDLEVPQEWVDIPSWAGDFYVGVQVCEDGTARIWGVTTHQQIKQVGDYDADDRTYFVDKQFLLTDLTAFEIIRERVETTTRAAIAPLSPLSNAQVENLIQRLSNPEITFPRLTVPFTLWGALLENAGWRQQLYRQRQGIPSLGAWLRGQFGETWQNIETILSPQQMASAWRSDTRLINEPRSVDFDVSLAKVLDFGSPVSESTGDLALVVGVRAISDIETKVGVQIYPTGGRSQLPNETQVRLVDESGIEIGQASAAITQSIQLQFRGRPGERFQVEVNCGEYSVTESFEI